MNNKPDPDVQPAVAAPVAKLLLTGPKRQHFLPKRYLEGFTKDGMVAVFDRESNEVRVQQPVNTGVIGHFYTMEDAEGRKRFELEQLLSECEDKASPVIKKLVAKEEINADERSDLAIFVSLAAFRTPDVVDSVKAFNSGLIGDMATRIFADVEVVKAQMRNTNLSLANHCQRFVIGREAALVRSLADHIGLASKKWQPKMQRA